MHGAIHGIWLIKAGEKIHPAIIPKLSAWATIASDADFQVVLWTNTDALTHEDIARLNTTKIVIADPSKCKASPLYKYYAFFEKQGLAGDKSAFALASDILRMAILDFTPADKYFIYVDPNDVEFLNLNANLQNLDAHMQNNKFGFAFPVGPTAANLEVFDIRNDVLIALKNKNPDFFTHYLRAYWENLERTHQRYTKPTTDAQAKLLAMTISNDTSTLFFRLEPTDLKSVNVMSQFANYSESYQIVNSGSYLNYSRVIEHGNTWLPVGAAYSVEEEVALNKKYLENLVADQNQALKTNGNRNQLANVNMYAVPIIVLLIVTVAYKMIKRKPKI